MANYICMNVYKQITNGKIPSNHTVLECKKTIENYSIIWIPSRQKIMGNTISLDNLIPSMHIIRSILKLNKGDFNTVMSVVMVLTVLHEY